MRFLANARNDSILGDKRERSGDSLNNFKSEKWFANRHFFPTKPPYHVVIPKRSEGSPSLILIF
jgi:hypothetical protein